MNPYSLELLARDKIATFHAEVAGTRAPRLSGGPFTHLSRLLARLSASRRWLRRTHQREAGLASTTREPGSA